MGWRQWGQNAMVLMPVPFATALVASAPFATACAAPFAAFAPLTAVWSSCSSWPFARRRQAMALQRGLQ
jgi:hypothetical protein